MEFHVNHPILYWIAGLLVAVVLWQSVYFLIKALRRSKELGMDQTKIRKTIRTAALFTVAPAVAIVIKLPSAFALFEWFPTILRAPALAAPQCCRLHEL